MKMRHFLPRIFAAIRHEAVTAMGQARLARRIANGLKEIHDFRLTRMGAEIIEGPIAPFRDGEEVHARLGKFVPENKHVLIFKNHFGIKLLAQDAGEDVVIVISFFGHFMSSHLSA